MLPDYGPNGPKYVGAIQRDILSVSRSILCFNKECICWQRSSELIKMHGKTIIKNGNENSRSIKRKKILNQLKNYQLLKDDSFPWC
jgi:hypothetical protein